MSYLRSFNRSSLINLRQQSNKSSHLAKRFFSSNINVQPSPNTFFPRNVNQVGRYSVNNVKLSNIHRHFTSIATNNSEMNPLLTKSSLQYQTPDFPKIKLEHFAPAMHQGIAEHINDIEVIANNPETATFENTIEAMELAGELLDRSTSVFFNLALSDSTEEIRAIEDEFSPILAQHSDNIFLNEALFARVKSIYENKDQLNLDVEQSRLLDYNYRKFVAAGANLPVEKKDKLRALNEEHATLTNRFSQNLVKMDETMGLVINDIAKLDGLSEEDIASAREAAIARGHKEEGVYVLTLVNTTRNPLLITLKDRKVREELWKLSSTRGCSGDINQTPLIERIISIRTEIAQLLGHETYAHFRLEDEMARKPVTVQEMLRKMIPSVIKNVEEEKSVIAKVMAAEMGIPVEDVVVEAWDWEHYTEKVRMEKYNFDENQLKPYFELTNVLDQVVFPVVRKLYGVTFEERPDVPVYHEDVKCFEVKNEDGSSIGLFFFDPFKRKGKSGGAWMSAFREQSRLIDQKPVIINVLNVVKNSLGPTNLTVDHIITLFHELGHGLHGLLSNCQYPSLSSTNTSTDFVEVPSQLMEDFFIHPDIVKKYVNAAGEVLPDELIAKMNDTRTFNQGFDTMEYMMATLIDLEWHLLKPEEAVELFKSPSAIHDFEKQVLEKYGCNMDVVAPRYRSTYFSHSLGGGYSAKYYAYIWSEIYAADANAYITSVTAGQPDSVWREIGQRLRDEVVSKGNSRDCDESYRAFRGAPVTTDALLVRRGINQ